jgi:zinc and cadmium transporter
VLFTILFFTFLASIISLFLVSVLLLHKTLIHKISFSLVAFAAGALLATGFLDTMKEAVSLAGDKVFLWVTLSIAIFFLTERLFLFLHHHDEEEDGKEKIKLPTAFLLFGDGLHNFIDGASIAASFLVSFPLGIVTTITVFVHEIPHELGDFGILIHKGWKKPEVLLANVATGVVAMAGALVAFYLGSIFHNAVPVLLSITTGNFIYLSATDLLPEIHHKAKKSLAFNYTLSFFLGIFFIAILIQLLG